jgi:TolA-binding protein
MMSTNSSRGNRRGPPPRGYRGTPPPPRPRSMDMSPVSSIVGSMISERAKVVGLMENFESDSEDDAISVTSTIENFNNNDETEPTTKDKQIDVLEQKIKEMSKYIAGLEANIQLYRTKESVCSSSTKESADTTMTIKDLKAQSKADVEEIALLKAENQIFLNDLKSFQGTEYLIIN